MSIKDIEGFEGIYAITDDGRVWAHKRRTPVGKTGGYREDGNCWLTPNKHANKSGYTSHRVYLAKGGEKHPRLVHRLVAEAFIPNPSSLPFINHIDGNPTNNHVSNLEWCNAQGNAKHSFDNGLTKMPDTRGEKNGVSKINDAMVRSIRSTYAELQNMSATARRLNVSRHCVRGVIKDGGWSHVS